MNLAFITIKTPTSSCLEKAALMVQSKVSRILSVSFGIICNAFVHSTSYLERTTDNALRNTNGSLCSVNHCCVKEIGSTGKSISKVLSNLIGLSL